MGQAVIHLPEENVAIMIPLKECVLSRFSKAHCSRTRSTSCKGSETYTGGPVDQIHLSKQIAAIEANPDEIHRRGHQVEESGRRVALKKASEYAIPEELQTRLDDDAVLKAAFESLTPGRRKSYIFHVSSAKQAKTRAARAEKCVPMILSGRGFNELLN